MDEGLQEFIQWLIREGASDYRSHHNNSREELKYEECIQC